jgi:hypothetical protein
MCRVFDLFYVMLVTCIYLWFYEGKVSEGKGKVHPVTYHEGAEGL